MAKTWQVVKGGEVISTLTCICPEPTFYKSCRDESDPDCVMHGPSKAGKKT